MRTLLNIAFVLLTAAAVMGQSDYKTHLPLGLKSLPAQIEATELMHVYVKAPLDSLQAFTARNSGTIKRKVGSYWALAIPYQDLLALDKTSFVDALHFEMSKGLPLLNESRANTRVNLVHDGLAELHSSFTGDGVIIGIIDAGLDLNHPDFLNPDSTTRVLELWDQTLIFNAQRTPSYGYGQVYDSADINAGVCPHEDQAIYFGHGTNTTGIAASTGLSGEDYTGIAPDADIIVVSSDFSAASWTNTVADAVDYIFERAEAYGMPCVINASLGSYVGSHDGRDLATIDIGNKITEAPGRAMVCAAGNSGELDPYHLGYSITSDTNFTWFEPKNNGTIFFELFSDTGAFEQARFAIGADKVSPNYQYRGNIDFGDIASRLNTINTDTLWSASGNVLAQVQTWAESFNGTYRLQFLVTGIDSIQYNFRLMMTGSGHFDLWSTSENIFSWNDMVSDNLPNTNQFPDIAFYKLPDSKQQIVSNWACSDKVITVGNYTNRTTYTDVDGNSVVFANLTTGALAASSSAGPSRTGLVKPEVTAPGELTLTAGADFQLQALLGNISLRPRVAESGLHHRAGGTSSASPVVAGIGALLFEACPESSWEDFKDALVNGARADNFTGTVPNDSWGYGKADAVNVIMHHQPNPALDASAEEFCDGEEVLLEVVGNYESYVWVSGDTGKFITVNQGNDYYAEVQSDLGCFGNSDTVQLKKRPLPAKPLIEMDGELPACGNESIRLSADQEFGAYQWSTGEFSEEIWVNETDTIRLTVKNIHGCENESDSVVVTFYDHRITPELILRADNELRVAHGSNDSTLSFEWYKNESLVANEQDSIYRFGSPGIYQAIAQDSNECRWSTNLISVGILKSESRDAAQVKIFPNPFTDVINIQTGASPINWELRSVDGALMQNGNSMNDAAQISTKELSIGTYILIVDQNNTSSKSLMIKE